MISPINITRVQKGCWMNNSHIEETLRYNIDKSKFYWYRYIDSGKNSFLKNAKNLCLITEKLSIKYYHRTEQIKVLSILSDIYWEEGNREKAKMQLKNIYKLSKDIRSL